jgi:hypothetical protein
MSDKTWTEHLKDIATFIGNAVDTGFSSIFGRMGVASGSAILQCQAAGSANFAAWAALTNTGKFTINVDGTVLTDVNPDFTGDSSMADVAASIQVALHAALAGTTCTWDGTAFRIGSPTVGNSSSVSQLSAPSGGVDLAAAGWMNGKAGYYNITDIIRALRANVAACAKTSELQAAADAAVTANAKVIEILNTVSFMTFVSIAPPQADARAAGVSVTITGTHFVDGMTVDIGGACTSVVVVNSTTITCTTPILPDRMSYDVVLTKGAQVVTAAAAFENNWED